MQSIEAFIGINWLMNVTALAISARSAGHIGWKRLLLASLLGTAYAAVGYGFLPLINGPVGQSVCLAVISLILFGGRRRGRVRRFVRLLAGTVFASGVMQLLARWTPLHGYALFFAGWTIVLLIERLLGGTECGDGQVRLRIGTRMGTTEVDALIDTGNRLREPLSGLPVVVVESRKLTGLLDPSCLGAPGRRLPPGFRLVRYSALGGQGEMLCFRPESVCIVGDKADLDAPDVWVAVYPNRLPSPVDAIAPSTFERMHAP